MRKSLQSVLCLAGALCLGGATCARVSAQTSPSKPPAAAAGLPSLPDDKVVATLSDGSSVTMGELRILLGNLDERSRQASMADLQVYFNKLSLARKLMQMALEDKLDQNSPIKEQLAMERMQLLDQAEVNVLSNPSNIDTNEMESFYKTNIANYTQVKLDDIYIGFTLSDAPQPAGEPKVLTKTEARKKIDWLLEKIKGGADFIKLAEENSDDDARTKKGYFETLSPADLNIPDVVRSAVFRLKQGEVTSVIEQPAGFYLFRAEEVTVKPFAEVRDQVYTQVKDQRFNRLFDEMRRANTAHLAPELLKKDDKK